MTTTVVMVHGIRTSATMWRAQVEHLAARGVIGVAVDLPGHGTRMAETFTLEGALQTIDTAVRDAASGGQVLLDRGFYNVSGLAWSGRGAITRVDVTLDGGKSWREARLVPNANPLSLHRFYLDHEWDGSEMLIQSRCIDATGYVQPTKDALREIRGLRSVYHNNGIQTWHVAADGRVENVEIS